MKKVFTAATDDADSASYETLGNKVQMLVTGTFDSGDVQLYQSPDAGTTWFPLGSGLSAAGSEVAEVFGAGALVRAEINNVAAAGASLDVWIGSVDGAAVVNS